MAGPRRVVAAPALIACVSALAAASFGGPLPSAAAARTPVPPPLSASLPPASSSASSSSGPVLRRVGTVRPRNASDVASSPWSVGAETQDRNYTVWQNWHQYLGPLGAKRARIEGGWARCEPTTPGVYEWAWLDEIVHGMHAVGVAPWVTLVFNNALYYESCSACPPPSAYSSAAAPLPDLGNATVRHAWTAWVQALSSRYAAIVSEFEVWNEPDLHFADAAYGRLLGETVSAVVAGNPGATIFANIASPKRGDYAASALAAAKASASPPSAFDAIKAVTYHPYAQNPDSYWADGTIADLKATVAKAFPGVTVLQGECGCPSTSGGYGALTQYDWNETSQAKWAVRRLATDWAHGIRWSSYFSIADMCYEKDGKLDINHKGLLEVDCSTKRVVRVKPAYRAVQALTSIVDGNVSAPGKLTWIHSGGRDVTRADATRAGSPVVLLWVNNVPPLGNTTFLANAAPVEVNLTSPKTALDDPVVVDMLSGVVYDAPGCAAGKESCAVPVYDGVVILAERASVPVAPG